MSLSIWSDDFGNFNRLRSDINKLFENSLSEQQKEINWAPRCDIKENENSIIVHADLPGVEKDNIKVNIEKNLLIISGDRKQEKKEENDKYHRIERFYGSFQRQIRIPDNTDPTSIKANFENGVLNIEIPKIAKKETSHSITIN